MNDFVWWVPFALTALLLVLLLWLGRQEAKDDAFERMDREKRQAEKDYLRQLQIDYYESQKSDLRPPR